MKTCLLYTTLNRTPLLRNSFERLLPQTLPDEILVVDDGGDDGCEALCEEFNDRLPIRYLYNHNPGKTICSMARNIGLKSTDADLLITCEPECMFLTDVVAQMLHRHGENPVDVISAGTVYHAQEAGELDPDRCTVTEGWVAPWVGLYGREWLYALGGWDESFPSDWGWDDTDLLTRLRVAGHGQVIDREIKLLHQWHEKTAIDQEANEAHFRGKTFVADERDTSDLIANKGSDWGVLREREAG